jgi:hypothetical protein
MDPDFKMAEAAQLARIERTPLGFGVVTCPLGFSILSILETLKMAAPIWAE